MTCAINTIKLNTRPSNALDAGNSVHSQSNKTHRSWLNIQYVRLFQPLLREIYTLEAPAVLLLSEGFLLCELVPCAKGKDHAEFLKNIRAFRIV
jgi:hypothetical protein